MAESIEHYARTVEQILHERRVLKQLTRQVRKPLPVVRDAIRDRALATLPKRGGLNEWVAAAVVKARISATGDGIRIHLSAGRDSARRRSDLKRIDAGRVRHPAWGRRTRGSWSVTTVEPGFFSKPASDPTPWLEAADQALDEALEAIR
jgi:hypothetical protein